MVYITKGNSKLKGIPIFSLPPEDTRINSTPLCRKYCYAQKAWKQYIRVRETRNKNYIESLKSDFVNKMIDEIQFMNVQFFRLHESGDFYSQEYLNKWFEIARKVSHITFFAWTKSWNLDWSNKPDNLIIYWSIWPDSEDIPKEGKFAYITDSSNKDFNYNIPDGFNCPYPEKTCNQCMHCFIKQPDIMIFRKH